MWHEAGQGLSTWPSHPTAPSPDTKPPRPCSRNSLTFSRCSAQDLTSNHHADEVAQPCRTATIAVITCMIGETRTPSLTLSAELLGYDMKYLDIGFIYRSLWPQRYRLFLCVTSSIYRLSAARTCARHKGTWLSALPDTASRA